MLKVFVIGADGMLGHDICNVFENEVELFKFTKAELDITKYEEVRKNILEIKPDVVLNCSGFTNVDACESKLEEAYKINGEVLLNLSKVCNEVKAKLVHISTDYVFDGEKAEPYQIDDKQNPINEYGKSKLLGEENTISYCEDYLIVRTQWLFGVNGNNFIKKIKSLAEKNGEVFVVADQFGKPTYTKDLAKGILLAIQKDCKGIMHITNSGSTSWYEFTKEIFKVLNINVNINAVDSNYFKEIAKRPKNSILDNSVFNKEVDFELRSHTEALKAYIIESGL